MTTPPPHTDPPPPSHPASASPPRPATTLTVPDAVARVRARDAAVRAFVTTRLDAALADARERAREAPRSPLHGAPYSLKDQWDTAGLTTTGGSHRHRARTPARSSPVHEAFESAGAVLIGKTNLSDMGLAPEASSYVAGATRNPHDLSRTAGGSSGGSAAAVADGMVAFDWGTDIGGSIRMPAAFCGVLGLKLSSETWPLQGMFPPPPANLAWMCGQGPIARSIDALRAAVAAAAPRLRVAGATAAPSFKARGAVLFAPERLGAWPSFRADVRGVMEAALDRGLAHAARLPSFPGMRTTYAAVWSSHFEDLLACDPSISLAEGLRGVLSAVVLRGALGNQHFHPTTAELLAAIALGRVTLFRNPARAIAAARAVRAQLGEVWAHDRVLVAPVCLYPAPRVGRSNRNLDLLTCTVPVNLTDATALAVPFGRFPDGLPRALQLIGPPGSEDELLALGERVIAASPHGG